MLQKAERNTNAIRWAYAERREADPTTFDSTSIETLLPSPMTFVVGVFLYGPFTADFSMIVVFWATVSCEK